MPVRQDALDAVERLRHYTFNFSRPDLELIETFLQRVDTSLRRELLRLWVQAEGMVAEVVDPDDTMTVLEAIRGRRQLVEEAYLAQLATDTVIRTMLLQEIYTPEEWARRKDEA